MLPPRFCSGDEYLSVCPPPKSATFISPSVDINRFSGLRSP